MTDYQNINKGLDYNTIEHFKCSDILFKNE